MSENGVGISATGKEEEFALISAKGKDLGKALDVLSMTKVGR